MRFTLEYPGEIPTAANEFLTPDALRGIAVLAEDCGFDAIALSDHPAPSVKWRRNGGHDSFEPAVALSFFAAVTNSIRLMTHLYVLPFRNPYLAAKALTSLDVVSGGRLIAAVGAGYLRSEFSALGASYEDRATLFDDGLEALVRIWTDPETPVEGNGFAGTGPMYLQSPVQRPHPPIWIGGNSKAAMRRVVGHGQGWCPVIAQESMASSIRTAAIPDAAAFGRRVAELHGQLTDAGRDPNSVDIQVEVPIIDFGHDASVRGAIGQLRELETHGATWAIVHVGAASVDAATDYIKRFAETVISRWPQQKDT